MTKDEALKLALLVLWTSATPKCEEAITAIKAALAQPDEDDLIIQYHEATIKRLEKRIDELMAQPDDFDSWQANPYTKVLMKSIEEDYSPKRQPLTDEQDRAVCEAYCNDASDEYFKARPALDFPEMRRIFYAGHRKAWITRDSAHGIGENTCKS